MLTIEGTTITLTRGDSASIKIGLRDSETNESYEPVEGDSIRFALSKQYGMESPLVLIDIPADTCILEIEPQHTTPTTTPCSATPLPTMTSTRCRLQETPPMHPTGSNCSMRTEIWSKKNPVTLPKSGVR